MLPKPLYETSVLPWESGFVLDRAEAGLPGISIVVPIYNAGRFLEKTLRSILFNDLGGIEIIVMDGGSNDNTGEILDHYAEYFAQCISAKDNGQSDAINKGFARATQPILYWLNGDDLLLPNTLVKVRRAFRDRPGTQVVVGDAYMTELDLAPIRHFKFSPETLTFEHLLDYAANHLVQPSVFFSRKAWSSCGPVAEDLHYAMDADLFLNMASRFRLEHLPVDISYSVYHEQCKTRGKRAESISELALVQAKHGGHAQARKTLNILVSMFNEAERAAAEKSLQAKCETCVVTQARLDALENDVRRQREALLDLDLELIRG